MLGNIRRRAPGPRGPGLQGEHMPRSFLARLAAAGLFATLTASADASSLRFYGNGIAAPDQDRVKIPIDDVGDSLPGPPADIGATDFTIEFWMKASAAENTAGSVACGDNLAWIEGNIVVDRDRYNQGRKFGVSIAGGTLVFGVSTESDSRTVCGSTDVLDDFWHHVAVTRDVDTGDLAIWVDGALDASTTGPAGDISYPDDGVPCPNCCDGGSCDFSDPFLVLGAEKHDAGASYPSYSGFLDELRLSSEIRYAAPFTPASSAFTGDATTLALYHFDEGADNLIGDSSGHPDGPSDGFRSYGGTPAGPEWAADTPFGDPADLDGDGKLNEDDECTVLVASQRLARTKVAFKGLGAGAGEQKLAWKGEFRPVTGSTVDPATDGLHLRIADGTGELVDVDLPAGLVGANPSTPCDADDGWTVKGSPTKPKYLYRNRSGFLDGACSVSSAGVEQVTILDLTQTDSPRVRYRIKGAGMTVDVTVPIVSIEAAIGLEARSAPPAASGAAQAGACGDASWSPVSFTKPAPYCKASPSADAPAKLQCATD